MNVTFWIPAIFFCFVTGSIYGQQLDRNIHIETYIDAPVEKVWQVWTTKEGLESFLAAEAHINLSIDGTIDVYFNPDAPVGQRGAEGLRILAVQPNKMFSFSWKNPPGLPEIRNQHTHVTLKFFPMGKQNTKTRLVLIHDGWGDGEIWDQAYQYFIKAWRDTVLFRLNYRFDKGPVNWSYPPQNTSKYNILIQ